MFDLTSGKLILLAVVALLVLGPKDFPILLRTVGKYLGIIKRQADEFREQFNEAIRESEFDQLKKEVEQLGREAEQTLHETGKAIETDIDSVRSEVERAADTPVTKAPGRDNPDPDAHDADGLPMTTVNGHHSDTLPAEPLPIAASPEGRAQTTALPEPGVRSPAEVISRT